MSDEYHRDVLEKLTELVRDEFLDGEDEELTATTPLMEWGILKSIETTRLVTYVRTEFGVRVPPAQVTTENFRDLQSIAGLVTALRG
ncbi:phosphopantetheine binding protein [Lentzea atacamensis]|jgi:acyl carrier protein|uniref:Phosphopantetheine binding protein n=2 Tax=Lentzea TaxID=165301 RepID=A0ABX9DY25_9PSEU|nr:acyl carrier protein [Lentzea atacamensis]RAS59208.1 phosphopantetheine binding protein [Lentzea atacamensis]